MGGDLTWAVPAPVLPGGSLRWRPRTIVPDADPFRPEVGILKQKPASLREFARAEGFADQRDRGIEVRHGHVDIRIAVTSATADRAAQVWRLQGVMEGVINSGTVPPQ